MEKEIKMTKSEYEDLIDYMQRLQETLEIVSNEKTVKKQNSALNRISSGDFISKEEMF